LSYLPHDKIYSAGSTVVVKDLQPGKTYLLHITAMNEVGFGNYEELRVRTKSHSKLLATFCLSGLLFLFPELISIGWVPKGEHMAIVETGI